MSVKAVLIPVEGKLSVVDFDDVYEGVQKALNGGWLEAAPAHPHLTVFCDEEGKLKGLPRNENANLIFPNLSMPGDYLAGPIVVMGPVDEDGYETDVPEWFVEAACG